MEIETEHAPRPLAGLTANTEVSPVVVNRSAQGLIWTTEQRRAVADQYLNDHPERKQPRDRYLREAMKKVLPQQLWRNYFSADDPVKRMIHEAQGTTPKRPDPRRSAAARIAAATRRMRAAGVAIDRPRKAPKRPASQELMTPEEIARIRPRLQRWQCPECAVGRDTPNGEPVRNIRKSANSLTHHRNKAHTARGRAIARRAGLNFQRGGKKKWRPWERKKLLTAELERRSGNRSFDVVQLPARDEEIVQAPDTVSRAEPTSRANPEGREVNFCPHCGWDIEATRKLDQQ